MSKLKFLLALTLMSVLVFAQVGNVAAAAPAQDTTPITGTIQSITLETDEEGVTTVLVTVLDGEGVEQTVRLSVETAVALGLVTLDPVTNEPIVDETQIGQTVEIDPTTVIPDEGEEEETDVHPISALLSAFFGEESSVIDGYHEDGFGFGVIAQALWMSQNLGGDPSLTAEILEAKETGDYSAFILPDGTSPTNWGQFRKAVLSKKNNLGVVVSGQAESPADVQPGNGNGNGHGNGNGQGNGGNGGGNGQGNGNGNGNGNRP